MFNQVLNTLLHFEMQSRTTEIATSCLSSLSEVFFKKKYRNSQSIQRRISTAESILSKVTPAVLLSSLSFMGNFLEILQGFKENSFQYKKQLFLRLTSHADMSVEGLRILLSSDYNRTSTSQEFLGLKCWVNKGATCQNILLSPVSLICLLYCITL